MNADGMQNEEWGGGVAEDAALAFLRCDETVDRPLTPVTVHGDQEEEEEVVMPLENNNDDAPFALEEAGILGYELRCIRSVAEGGVGSKRPREEQVVCAEWVQQAPAHEEEEEEVDALPLPPPPSTAVKLHPPAEFLRVLPPREYVKPTFWKCGLSERNAPVNKGFGHKVVGRLTLEDVARAYDRLRVHGSQEEEGPFKQSWLSDSITHFCEVELPPRYKAAFNLCCGPLEGIVSEHNLQTSICPFLGPQGEMPRMKRVFGTVSICERVRRGAGTSLKVISGVELRLLKETEPPIADGGAGGAGGACAVWMCIAAGVSPEQEGHRMWGYLVRAVEEVVRYCALTGYFHDVCGVRSGTRVDLMAVPSDPWTFHGVVAGNFSILRRPYWTVMDTVNRDTLLVPVVSPEEPKKLAPRRFVQRRDGMRWYPDATDSVVAGVSFLRMFAQVLGMKALTFYHCPDAAEVGDLAHGNGRKDARPRWAAIADRMRDRWFVGGLLPYRHVGDVLMGLLMGGYIRSMGTELDTKNLEAMDELASRMILCGRAADMAQWMRPSAPRNVLKDPAAVQDAMREALKRLVMECMIPDQSSADFIRHMRADCAREVGGLVARFWAKSAMTMTQEGGALCPPPVVRTVVLWKLSTEEERSVVTPSDREDKPVGVAFLFMDAPVQTDSGGRTLRPVEAFVYCGTPFADLALLFRVMEVALHVMCHEHVVSLRVRTRISLPTLMVSMGSLLDRYKVEVPGMNVDAAVITPILCREFATAAGCSVGADAHARRLA